MHVRGDDHRPRTGLHCRARPDVNGFMIQVLILSPSLTTAPYLLLRTQLGPRLGRYLGRLSMYVVPVALCWRHGRLSARESSTLLPSVSMSERPMVDCVGPAVSLPPSLSLYGSERIQSLHAPVTERAFSTARPFWQMQASDHDRYPGIYPVPIYRICCVLVSFGLRGCSTNAV